MCHVRPIIWLSVLSMVSASDWISTPADLTRCEGESVDLVWVYPGENVKAVAIQKTSSYIQIEHSLVTPRQTNRKELHVNIDNLKVSDSDTYEALVALEDGILIHSAALTVLPSSDSDCPSSFAYYAPLISVMVNDKPYLELTDEPSPITVQEGDLLTITAHIQQTQPHIVVITSINGKVKTCIVTECTIQVRLKKPGDYLYSLTLKHEYRQDSNNMRDVIVKATSIRNKESITTVKARTTDSTIENSDTHLSAGMIVGIIVGVLVILGLIVAAMIFVVLRLKNKSNGSKEEGNTDDDKKKATKEETLSLSAITNVSQG